MKRRQLERTQRATSVEVARPPTSSWRGRNRGRGRGRGRALGMAASHRGGAPKRTEERPVYLSPVDIFLDNVAREIEDETLRITCMSPLSFAIAHIIS